MVVVISVIISIVLRVLHLYTETDRAQEMTASYVRLGELCKKYERQ